MARCLLLFMGTVLALASAASQSAAYEESVIRRPRLMREVSILTDDDLAQRIQTCLPCNRHDDDYLEIALSEAVRRGGKYWTNFLTQLAQALNSAKIRRWLDEDEESAEQHNQAIMFALRRVEGRPDPLKVFIGADGPLVAHPLKWPRLNVTIRNVDGERQNIGFKFGGDTRGGRQDRWRVRVFDDEGRVLPVRPRFGRIAGGTYNEGVLASGDEWSTTLDLHSFLEALPVGNYRLQVLYHNCERIADMTDVRELAGLIVATSDSVPLTVELLMLRVTAIEHQQVRNWIAELDTKPPVKIVAGTYGPWAHDFINPKSPAGRILQLGPKSLPAIMEILKEAGTDTVRKAWLFGLLFSITGEHDPRDRFGSSVLPNNQSLNGGWEIWGGPNEKNLSGTISFPGSWSGGSGKIDPNAQQKLTNTWVKWMESVKVTLVQ